MIERTTRDRIALLRLCHGKASALDLELLEALAAAVADESRGDARALVLTGTGSIFSAGVDLRRMLADGRAYLERFLPALDRALLGLFDCPKPVVAAVNGHAIAGGWILACAADQRLLARGKAALSLPELEVGVPFPPVALEIVRQAMPSHLVASTVLAGRRFADEEALALGLVDELVDAEALLDRAVAVAARLGAVSGTAFAASKAALHRPALDRIAGHGADAAARVLDAWSSAEVLAAVQAYVDRTLTR